MENVPCFTADKPTHIAVRKGLSAVSGAWLLPANLSLPDAELTCHFPCAVKAFVTVIACFLFLLISLSREWSSRIESAMVCNSTVLLRLRWQPAVFWLTGCSSKICMKLFFHGSAEWWKEEVEGTGGRLSGHSGVGRADQAAPACICSCALPVTRGLVRRNYFCPHKSLPSFYSALPRGVCQ